ncbi:MAG: hypothetical protein KKC19_00765 [Nanoarchaeota archaeon]|nr:hypothetical protein [Nanoarchaeota archaeon]
MEENKEKFATKFRRFHDKNYKYLLLVPAVVLLLCFVYLAFFYSSTGDFIYKDISLTGGTSITIYESLDIEGLRTHLSENVDSFVLREISDPLTGIPVAVVIESTSNQEALTTFVEGYLGHDLTEENSSIEFTGSDLSENFFNQLLFAILTAFLFMGWVVFLIFGDSTRTKIITGFLSIFPTLLFFFFRPSLSVIFISSFLALAINIFFYLKESIPSLAIILSAFADIIMTLVVFNIFGLQMSTAGIVAFLMLIGYSVDTDILLTNRVLKRKEGSLNERLLSALKTGMTMTLTSLLALIAALLIVMPFSAVLTKIFLILVIGLGFDIMNTWITNVSILKWWCLNKNEN